MTYHPDIVERMTYAQRLFNRTASVSWRVRTDCSAIGAEADAEITRLRAEAEELRSVMIAAAEEIQAHWPAHCDAEGYGPANLMRRLEEGIPSQYAYTAGDFVRLRDEAEALRKLLQECRDFFENCPSYDGADTNNLDTRCMDAIAATKEQQA
jgi:hypothetical protein